LIVLATIFYSPLLFGQVYQWVDEKGKTHFSDTPPPASYQSMEVEIRTSAPDTSTPPSTPSVENILRGYTQRRQQKKQQQAEQKQKQASMQRQCASLRERLRYYDGYRHRRTNYKGSTYYLSDTEIKQEKQQIEEAIRKHCRS